MSLVAAGERVRVLLVDGAVRRPARVAEPGRRTASRSARPRASAPGGCRRRARSRARRPRAARARPSRSRGTRAARGPGAESSLQARWPTYPMIPHTPKPPLERERPGCSPGPLVGPVSRALVARERAMVAQSFFGLRSRFGLGEHADRRAPCRRAAREPGPRPSSSLVQPRRPPRAAPAGSSLAGNRTFSFTCGKRGMTAAASSSVRPSQRTAEQERRRRGRRR